MLGGLARRPRARATGDGPPLASGGIPILLATSVAAAARPTSRCRRHEGPHSPDSARQFSLGRAAHPSRGEPAMICLSADGAPRRRAEDALQ
jgi:hypothetical protein